MAGALTPGAMVEAAQRETGLEDLGERGWESGLEVLLDSAARDADLNQAGVGVLCSWIHRRLVNRLQVIDWVKRHPELSDQQIRSPLFVIGMTRTGTTILSELLARDPANRPLMKWEALSCCPPPERASFASDPRIEKAIGEVEFQYEMVPELRAVHYEPGDGPTECVSLLGQSFWSQDWLGLFRVPAFVDWYRHCDKGPAYRYHRLALQLLQSKMGGRWSLKAPGHMHGLEALRAVYPDAQLIVTHRDPLKTVPSMASLSTASRPESLTSGREPLHGYFGRLWLDELALMVERMMEFRDLHGDMNVYDLPYHRFVKDPLGEIQLAYEYFGEPLSGEAERAMRAPLERSPKGRYGTHRYEIGDFGLHADEIRERFSSYTKRFEIPEEDEA